MNYLVSSLRLPLDAGLPHQDDLIKQCLANALHVQARDILAFQLKKRSVDARQKGQVHFVATLVVTIAGGVVPAPKQPVTVSPYRPPRSYSVPHCSSRFRCSGEPRPIVVGSGPAGLFAALILARAGFCPLVIERGSDVDVRTEQVESFNGGGALDVESNVQFGEGGAGTFSDGKLYTGTKRGPASFVFETFVAAGAPRDILWHSHPHIGTDRLLGVVRRLREFIQEAGGEVRFHNRLDSIEFHEGRVRYARITNTLTGVSEVLEVRRLVLACGHSARDTFTMLRGLGIPLERKPFSLGVRIEHPQALINHARYHGVSSHKALEAADYRLSVHTKEGRGVYTFCMSPGGTVVAAASEEGGLCVNGMSNYDRSGTNANSALLVDVRPSDFLSTDPLAGVDFQRRWEQVAYNVGVAQHNADFTAPVSCVSDFLSGSEGRVSEAVEPSYPRGVHWTSLVPCLPDFVSASLKEALPLLDKKLSGFAFNDAVMTAVESRSSSPVRILRDASFQAELMLGRQSGLYPCGEGAGYAGGIISAAVDGIRVAEALCSSFE